MGRSIQYLTFEGQFESGVLGVFKIIRGFANLKDLAEVSVSFPMEAAVDGIQVIGQQRTIDSLHAERIKRYLESGAQRFLPEVILSVRCDLNEILDDKQKPIGVETKTTDSGIGIKRRSKNSNIRVHQMWVDRKKLDAIKRDKLIRRVDGNHRLALAETLVDDPGVPTKYLASFCLVLLGAPENTADDYSESLIFHTINSTALPLESEHALKLILGQHSDYNMTPGNEFAFSPDLHFTRLLRDGLMKLPQPAQARLGNRPLTSLRNAVRGLMDTDPNVSKDLASQEKYSKDLVAALNDIVTRLEPNQPLLCQSEFFIELAARIWKSTPDTDKHKMRVNATVSILEQLAGWLGKDGFLGLKENQSLSKQVLNLFNTVRTRVPRRVFLARWYPTSEDGEESNKAKLRLKQIKQTLRELEREGDMKLDLIDMGTQTGATFPIHAKMYEAIESADIILIDLTGVRPNVCVEAGFALRHHEKNRLIFIFQPIKKVKNIPFDLNTFRYETFKDTGEIPEKIKHHITEIIQGAKKGLA